MKARQRHLAILYVVPEDEGVMTEFEDYIAETVNTLHKWCVLCFTENVCEDIPELEDN